MVDRSGIEKAVIIADRGFESYNVLAHIQKKDWKFLIHVKDGDRGIVSGLDLPDSDEFDLPIKLRLSNQLSNQIKELYKDRNRFRYIPSTSTFDFLPSKSRKRDPLISLICTFTLFVLKSLTQPLRPSLPISLILQMKSKRYPRFFCAGEGVSLFLTWKRLLEGKTTDAAKIHFPANLSGETGAPRNAKTAGWQGVFRLEISPVGEQNCQFHR